AKLDVRQVVGDLVDGVVFIRDHPKVRPWLVGIGLTFAAAGAVFALGVDFVRSVLGGGEKGFSSVIGFLAAGMIIGLLSTSVWVRRMHKDILFSASILLLGVGLIAFASMGSLSAAIPLASALGFFGGIGYSVGYSLLHETTDDDVRGRTFSVAYTVIRIGMLGGLGLFPVLAGAIGHHHIGGYPLPGARITLWAAGLIATGGGLLSMRAIRARAAEGRPEATAGNNAPGFFLVFEGADGAGKTTQIQALVRWLQARGDDVVVTREPGGTEIGRRIRALLLDSSSQDMDPRTEALLYAADRAQHVAQVIRPALQSGKVVVSDRFIDSSLAYQGIARGLGVDAISDISSWGTNGLLPDLVVFLDIDRGRGMERLGSALDRIEGEGREFQQRVNLAYRELAAAHPERFVVLDADRPPSEIHEDVKRAFLERCESPRHTPAPGAAGPPAVGESPQGAEPSSAETSPTRPLR
ncbi:MAG TPA: dTMP kinase, partial [Actinomycetota bacterium]|nr:dTMP kinase [Actinomycetota bacterium]